MFKRLIVAALLVFVSTSVFAANLIQPSEMSPFQRWAKKQEGKLSIGVVGGFELRYVTTKQYDESGTRVISYRKEFKSYGALTVGVVKYAVWKQFECFAGYGLAQQKFLEGSQVAVVGITYSDYIGFTVFGGFDVGACAPNGCGPDKVFGAINDFQDRWFIGIGASIDGIEFDLTDVFNNDDKTP